MYTYGPVPSRRLGKSIGVSPIPSKTCSYSCVYCQLGRTTNFTIDRASFFDPNTILTELNRRIENSEPDFITFVGDGEPTLCKELGWMLEQCKQRFDTPTAVITNGSLIYRDDVKKELQNADLILPSIDAGTEETFKKINRPHKNLNFEEIISGIIDFSKIFEGKLWTETMLVKGYNDSKDELQNIKSIIDKINPDKTFIMAPTRPPAEDVTSPEPELYLYAQKLINQAKTITNLEKGDFEISNYKDAREAIMELSSRHPLRKEQAQWIAKQFGQQQAIRKSVQNGELIVKKYAGTKYVLPGKLFNR
ncbi:MAG: radical SAM protein [Candidatus Marinimicrobia bacterium]|nr:radical SAM protein [Candidatus Neomarinimicrobiota bacterium]